MKYFVSTILVLIVISSQSQQPQYGPSIKFALTSANITNFPVATLNADHYWLASDLAAGRIFNNIGWTDRVTGLQAWSWVTNNLRGTSPTNTATGLDFESAQSLVLSNAGGSTFNSLGFSNSNKRAVFFVFSTTKNTAEAFVTQFALTGNGGGVWWNNSSGGSSAAGRRTYHANSGGGSDLGGADNLKTDGTVQDVGINCTNVTTPSAPIVNGYTNGLLSVSAITITGDSMSGLGDNSFGYSGNVLAIISNTNLSDPTTWFSNAHYWRTNMFGGSP